MSVDEQMHRLSARFSQPRTHSATARASSSASLILRISSAFARAAASPLGSSSREYQWISLFWECGQTRASG